MENIEYVHYSEKNVDEIYKLNLKIPKYQRIYTWGYEQVKTLLDDIFNVKIDKYFIGSVILHKRDGDYDIVDGQQRIVTIALIKYALFKEELLPDDINKFLENEYASLEAQINISNNVSFISQYLSDSIRKKKISENINKICIGVLVIDRAENLDLAFTFFSNTNSKGKKLTDYDLLKPHHLRYIPSDLEEQQRHLALKWDEMINKARDLKKDSSSCQDDREYVSYIRLIEIMIYRLRNWEQMNVCNEGEDYHIKKEFEAASIINEIPPFCEQFKYGEPIQGGQHFFAYVEHFIDEYNKFGFKPDYGPCVKDMINHYFGKYGSNSWYGSVIEALVFCYYLKFGNNYIYEATMSIVRYISIIRFRLARAYKATIIEWARQSKIVLDIDRATSPTFFLASIEKRIDNAPNFDNRIEDAQKGVRNNFLRNCCKPFTEDLMKETNVIYYKNYYTDRYGNLC